MLDWVEKISRQKWNWWKADKKLNNIDNRAKVKKITTAISLKFDSRRPLQPSLMFMGKARSLP